MTKDSFQISQRVDNYIKYRPHYPQAVLDLLAAECQLSRTHIIADIGSGTGILSKLFLEYGNQVMGIEPDPDMRRGGEMVLKNFPNFASITGTAEATTLPDRAVDFVTAGQAFHWFNLEQARTEFKRILVPRGWVVLVWNVQRTGDSPFLEALQAFWETKNFWKETQGGSAKQMARVEAYRLDSDLVRRELLDPFFGLGGYQEAFFENPMVCDFQAFKGRILSNKPALEPNDPHYDTMLAALEQIFHDHQTDGTVTIEHDTRVVYGQLLDK